MKTLALICAAVAVMASIGCATMWTKLRTERQANEALRARITDVSVTGLAHARAMPVTASAAPTPAAAAAATADPSVCKPDTAETGPAQTAAVNSLESSMNLQRELLKDPEYRKLRLAQTRTTMERGYPGLAEELGLTEKEADRLLDLLAQNQIATTEELQLLPSGTPDQAAVEERSRRQMAMQREQEEAVRTMLGGKYSQWQDYQQTRPARSRVTSLGTQLAQAGAPLTQAQTRSLTTAMIAEQQRQTQEARTMPRAAPAPVNPADPDARVKRMEESLKRTEENNRRMVEAAGPHLTAKQLAAYKEQMDQQHNMNRISLKLQIQQQRLQSQMQPE